MTRIADSATQLRTFLQNIQGLSPTQSADWMQEAITVSGGSYLLPDAPIGKPATHLVEVQLFGVSAFGADRDECARNWCKVARASLQAVAA